MAYVTNKDRFGNPIDFNEMLKKFKRQVTREGILQELRLRQYYVPKSLARKEKSKRHQLLVQRYKKNRNKKKLY